MVKEIASNYIFALMLSCLESDRDGLEYHDAKAALEDLRSITLTVYGMVKDSGVKCPFSTVFMYCAKYQDEALDLL